MIVNHDNSFSSLLSVYLAFDFVSAVVRSTRAGLIVGLLLASLFCSYSYCFILKEIL